MGNDGICKICIREKEREEREKRGDIGEAEAKSKLSSRENEENAKLHSSKAADAESPYIADAKPYIAYIAGSPDSGSIEAELQQVEAQRAAKEAHFKTPPKDPIICAVCGEDLTGKGQVERNGKHYCPRPGCGYPAREASA